MNILIYRKIKRALLFLAGNIAAQGLAALSGLLLARWLSVSDYAIYSIVFTVMGAITVLTKGGVHLGFTAILGRTWPDMTRAAQAIQSVLRVRHMLSIFILPPVLLMSGTLLWQNGAPALLICLLLCLLVIFWWADMRTKVVDQILYFAHQTTRIQMLDTSLAAIRLLTIPALYVTGYLNVLTAVLLAALVAILRIRPIIMWIHKLLPAGAHTSNPSDLAEMKAGVRRQMPVEIFYVFQAQIVLFVLSYFATSTDVAGYGALSRITQLLLPFQAFMYAFCVPIFARSTSKQGTLLLGLVALASLPGIMLIGVAALQPSMLLWLIGPNYADLQQETLIAAAVAAFSSAAGTAWSLVAHRGLVRWSWLQIPIGLIWCVIASLIFNLGTIKGALLLQGGFSIGLIVAATMDFIRQPRTGSDLTN
ncbi:hypothetical protein [Pseudomonas helleri]|uniref:hypothetical protein n=1 Tax=Pseudomonas helleri TaxID=1608996 RepID=UPI0012F74519|nr:hypothetical protein [Pseudomonas helleri]